MLSFRNLLPQERDSVQAHYLRLDQDDRLLRFFGHTKDCIIEDHCRQIDWQRAVIIGCFDAGTLRGLAELQLDSPYLPGPYSPAGGELAISVEKAWQGQGVGTELLRLALITARNRSLRKLTMLCLLDNQPMRHVAQKFADDLHIEDGSVEVGIALPFPTCMSLWQEGMTNSLGFARAWYDFMTAKPANAPATVEAA